MRFRRDLFRFLRGVAKQEGAGISWGFSPRDKKYPRIVLRWTGDNPEHHTRGGCNFSTASVQITAYARATQDRTAHEVADDVADALSAKLNDYYGPCEGSFIHSAELEDRYQIEEQPNDKGGWIAGTVLEFNIAHGMAGRATA